MSHGATPQVTETANVQGGKWQFVDNSPDITDLKTLTAQQDGKEQVSYTATFDDMSPVAVKVSQAASDAAGLFVYADPLIINNSGKEWTGMQTSLVSTNNVVSDALHPPFAHYHEKDTATPTWTTPDLGPFTTLGGGNSTKNAVALGPHGLNGADELYGYGTLASGSQAQFDNLGIHQFQQLDMAGTPAGGEFYIVHAPNHLPFHSATYAMPSLNSVNEGDGTDNNYSGDAKNNLAFGYGGNDTLAGGDGRDILVGGAGFDMLAGETGDDWLFGGLNEDVLMGGVGKDLLDGGDGKDVADYRYETNPVQVDLGTPESNGFVFAKVNGLNEDILANIEDIWGGQGNDRLTGNAKDNDLSGGGGADTLQGGDGADRLEGGAGDDVIDGGLGTDHAVFSGALADYTVKTSGTTTTVIHKPGTGGTDTLTGVENLSFSDQTIATPQDLSAGAPFVPDPNPPANAPPGSHIIAGTGKSETLNGTNSADGLFGHAGNDRINAKNGDDFVAGGSGNDTIQGGKGYDLIRGGQGADQIKGGDGDDIIYSDRDNDSVWGDKGADQLWGGRGHDKLLGGDGDDLLVGELGNDTLDGGAGADVFAFWANDGHDKIVKFDQDDQIVFKGLSTADVAITASSSETNFSWSSGSVTVSSIVGAATGLAEGTDYFFV